jgi:hypothetical protein
VPTLPFPICMDPCLVEWKVSNFRRVI